MTKRQLRMTLGALFGIAFALFTAWASGFDFEERGMIAAMVVFGSAGAACIGAAITQIDLL